MKKLDRLKTEKKLSDLREYLADQCEEINGMGLENALLIIALGGKEAFAKLPNKFDETIISREQVNLLASISVLTHMVYQAYDRIAYLEAAIGLGTETNESKMVH